MVSRHHTRRRNQRYAESNVRGTGPLIVTAWYRDLGDGLQYNHYSVGFNELHEDPAYMFESQRIAWAGWIWVGKKSTLIDGVVAEAA